MQTSALGRPLRTEQLHSRRTRRTVVFNGRCRVERARFSSLLKSYCRRPDVFCRAASTNRFRLRITSGSVCAPLPVPSAHHFRLRTTSCSGGALLPVPVAHSVRFRLRITSGSGSALLPVPVAHYFRFQLRSTSDSCCALLPVPVS